MRDPARIPRVLAAVEAYWLRHPDLRLGQLVSNAATAVNSHGDPFYLEDDALLRAISSLPERRHVPE